MSVTIALSQGYSTLVDDEDAYLASLKWFANRYPNGRVYAVRNKPGSGRGLLRLHRVIAEAADGLEVDHINGDTLDNRRANLRIATRAENAQNLAVRKTNRSGYRGVRFISGRWQARVQRNRQIVYSQFFSTVDDAVLAVQLARKRLLPFDYQGIVGIQDVPSPSPAPSRHNRDRTHCRRGHLLSGDNLRIEGHGARRCLACRRLSRHEQPEQIRAATEALTGRDWPWNRTVKANR